MRALQLILILPFLAILGPVNARCFDAMPDQIFDQHYRAISNTNGDGNRLEMSRQLVRNYCVSTVQVADLMQLLNSEGNRLELARSGYQSVVDPENYISLTELLNSSGNRQELYRWTQSQYQGQPSYQPDDRDERRRDEFIYGDDDDCDEWDDDDRNRQGRGRQRTNQGRGNAYGQSRGRGNGRGRSPRARMLTPLERVVMEMDWERNNASKALIMRRYVIANPVCTRDVMQLLSRIQSPQQQLASAKHAFRFVSDPGRYRQVLGTIQSRRHQAEMRAWLIRRGA